MRGVARLHPRRRSRPRYVTGRRTPTLLHNQSTRSECCRALRTTTRPLQSHRLPGRQYYRQAPFQRHSGTHGPDGPTRRQTVITDTASGHRRCRTSVRCRLFCCRRCSAVVIFSLYVLPTSVCSSSFSYFSFLCIPVRPMRPV